MTIYNTRNPLGSTDPRDLFDNAQNYDIAINSITQAIWLDRFGVTRRSWYGLELMVTEAAAKFGLVTLTGVSFVTGATVNLNEALLNPADNCYYQWTGTFPLGGKEVPPNSTPQSTGGQGPGKWLNVLDTALRSQLNTNSGAGMIRAEDGRTVQEWLIANDSAEYRAKNIAKLGWVDYQIHNRGALKALFQGDSMTAGYDVTSTDTVPPENGDHERHATWTYPDRFVDFLSQQSGCAVIPTIRAISGYTAQGAYDNPDWQTNPGCDVVVLMYAINDSGGDINAYMDYMERLIRRFIDWGMAVVVCIPDGGQKATGNPKWLHWARRMRMMAHIYGCASFDAFETTAYSHDGAVQSDGLHYNSIGYSTMAIRLASMFMAGGLLETYHPVSNETITWPARFSDSIGWCDALGNIATDQQDGAWTRGKITGIFPAKTHAVGTFSFYLDAEAAHLYGKVGGPLQVIKDITRWTNLPGQPYYDLADTQAGSYGMMLQRIGEQINDIGYGPNKGASQFLGRIVGRGWHTVTFFTSFDASQTADAFLNSLTISPIPLGMSTEAMWGQDEERRVRVVHCKKLPSPARQEGVPSPVQLNSFFLRAPQSLVGTGKGARMVTNPYYYNSGTAKLRLVTHGGFVFEGHLIMTQQGWEFRVVELQNNFPDGNKPTIKATFATAKKLMLYPAGSIGQNQPLQNIFDYNGGVVKVSDPDFPGDMAGGVYLLFEITWPTGSPADYWNIELEGTDWFGNSETAWGNV